MNELYIKRRAEMLAKEFIDLLIDAEEFDSYRKADDPISEETVNGLKEYINAVRKESLEVENEFSIAFFRMIGFYPQFYSDHVYDNDNYLFFLFKLSGLESDSVIVEVIYDREGREGETILRVGPHWSISLGYIYPSNDDVYLGCVNR